VARITDPLDIPETSCSEPEEFQILEIRIVSFEHKLKEESP
jgi:hypothetical protein